MNFASRAFISITRNFNKAILLLLVVFTLGCVISGAISVSNAVQDTDANIRAAIPAIVTVGIDHSALNDFVDATGAEPDGLDEFTSDTLLEIATFPQVASYDFSIGGLLLSSELEPYVPLISSVISYPMGNYNSFRLAGIQHVNPLDISEGAIEIVQGRMFTETELENFISVAVVSENFARLNNLGVGSTLFLEDISWDMRDMQGIDQEDSFYVEENIYDRRAYQLEIVGIYASLLEVRTGDRLNDDWIAYDGQNRIYVPNTFAREVHVWYTERQMELFPDVEHFVGKTPEDLILFENVLRLHDSSDIPAFREAVEAATPPFYTVIDAGSESIDFGASLDSLDNLSTTVLVIAVAATVLILSLFIVLFLRERKREIGIYLALGDKRGKIIAQMMAEVLPAALVALSLSLFVGNILAANISENILRADLIAAQRELANQSSNSGGVLDRLGIDASTSAEGVMIDYSVSLNGQTILMVFAVGTSTVLIATLVPMLYILRLNPRKILT